jgi:uncharacterized membrane protein YbhN (UPF0104 family)
MGDLVSGIAAAVARACAELVQALSGAALGWLLLGVALHMAQQVARGRGWYAIVRMACPAGEAPRARDAIGVWIAGAGASGVLSARGGDAVRVFLLGRAPCGPACPLLAGTLVAEAAGDVAIGMVVLVGASGVGVGPGLGVPAPAVPLALALATTAAVLLHRRAAALVLAPDGSRVRRLVGGLVRGCAPMTELRGYGYGVLPWQVASRALRAAAVACFLLAFHLPATIAAVLLVSLAQGSGRMLPLAPASVGASVAVLAAGFGPATGTSPSLGQLGAFVLGTSTVLTLAGLALALVIAARTLGVQGLRGALPTLRRAARESAPAPAAEVSPPALAPTGNP